MGSDYAIWPSWMPAPQQDSFSIQPEDRRLTSETEAGSIIRKQFDTDVNIADCTIILNRIQAAWFELFERDILAQGSVWFEFPLWIGGEVVREKCRFKTRPKAGSLIGLHTTYTFQLYVSKRTFAIPDCLAKAFVCWPPCFWTALNAALERFFAVAPSWQAAAEDRLEILFGPLFSKLSTVTEVGVADALSEMTEE